MTITREEAITIIDNLHLIGCGRNQHEDDLKINVALDMAIEALSEPYWIPISERLPDENERRKSYDRTKYASEFIVMIEGATNPTTLYLTMDNYWKDDNGVFYSVIAWMPLPMPLPKGW